MDIHEILKYLPHRYPFLLVDRVLSCESGKEIVALKNVTINEPYFMGHFPAMPIMPGVLVAEAMAQTAGILVGEAKNFQEKVILAKIKKAVFFDYVKPGDTIKLDTKIESIVHEAASTSGKITCADKLIAEIDLMFSHIDQNLAGKEFPQENFVFTADTSVFESLLRDVVSGGNGSVAADSEQD